MTCANVSRVPIRPENCAHSTRCPVAASSLLSLAELMGCWHRRLHVGGDSTAHGAAWPNARSA
eukprot:scaffold1496_cov110-Isochrysis_galbana.AAC.15